jgi:hypothetical protein
MASREHPAAESIESDGSAGAASDSDLFQRGLDAFNDEPVDQTWAGKIRPVVEKWLLIHVYGHFRGLEYGPVECRSHHCSFEVRSSHGEDLDLHRVMRQIGADLRRSGHNGHVQSYASRPNLTGPGTIGRFYLYFARTQH